MDVIEGSDDAIVLGCVARYFDNCAGIESEDFNCEADTAVVVEVDLRNLGVRHGWGPFRVHIGQGI